MLSSGYGKDPIPPPPPLGTFLLRTLDHPSSEKAFESLLGNPQAPIVIVVYGSLSCSACADVHTKSIEPLLGKYKEKICFLLKDYPIDGPSTHAMLLTWCVPEKAQALRKSFYLEQEKWVNAEDFKKALQEIAENHGLTTQQCQACFEQKALLLEIATFRTKEKEGTHLKYVPLIYLVHRKPSPQGSVALKVVELQAPEELDLLISKTLREGP